VNEIEPKYLAGADLLARAPKLLLVSTMGAGYDTVDVAACTLAGVAVVNQGGGGNAQAVAEHVLGMMLCLSKRIAEADRHMRREAGVNRHDFVGRNALGKTLGIIGFGNVGTSLAALCRSALRMRILVHDAYRDAETIAVQGCEQAPLDELLARSDFVVVCCSLTGETRGMIGARQFASMQKHAYFVTAARGGIHDEAALIEALREKRIAGAGVDVWDVEPPLPDHPLLEMDNVIATPHIGGATIESRIQAAQAAARQILEVFEGRRPPRLLNPQAWPLFCTRFEREFGFRPEPV
jgi:D-3-phosphoglycerate dehydrogenase